VAQTRLPVFYRSFDTLEPRFTLLALHFFAVLAPLGQRGVRGQDNGGSAFIGAIKATLRDETENAELRSKALASYLLLGANSLDQQPFASLRGGQLEFPDVTKSR